MRRRNIVIRGLQVPKDSNVVDCVTSWIHSNLSLSSVVPEDIDVAHPLPTGSRRSNRSRIESSATIVRFHKREVRDKIIQARKVFKGTPYSISDDLTNLNVQLLNRLKNDDRISGAWSWQGKIFAKVNDKIIVAKLFQTC